MITFISNQMWENSFFSDKTRIVEKLIDGPKSVLFLQNSTVAIITYYTYIVDLECAPRLGENILEH